MSLCTAIDDPVVMKCQKKLRQSASETKPQLDVSMQGN